MRSKRRREEDIKIGKRKSVVIIHILQRRIFTLPPPHLCEAAS
jgi:hypothetical protein